MGSRGPQPETTIMCMQMLPMLDPNSEDPVLISGMGGER